MIKSESRKSNLFSALKSRRSLKDLSARVQKTTSLISGPFAQSPQDPHTSANTAAPSPLAPLDLNTAQGKRLSKAYFSGDQENSKRHSLAWKKRPSSPASEVTLATISAMPSDLASVDSTYVELPSPTVAEHTHENNPETHDKSHLENDENRHEKTQIYSTSLAAQPRRYTQYADYSDLDEPCTPTRIHRTTNIGDIRKFMESDDMLPMSNRKSLEFEAHEIQMHRSRICAHDDARDCEVRLVENAFVMTFFGVARESRFWDELDVDDALKGADDEDMLGADEGG